MGLFEIVKKMYERLVFIQYAAKYLLSRRRLFYVDHALLRYWLVKCFLTGRVANKIFKAKSLSNLGRIIKIEYTRDIMKCVIKGGVELSIHVPPHSRRWVVALIHDILEDDHYFHGAVRLKEDDIVIDGGSHIGIFSIVATRVFKCARVYAFEPEEKNFSFLVKNIREIENVVPIRCALGNRDGTARLYVHEDAGAHSLIVKTEKFQNVPMCSLDSFVKREGLDRVDFVKLDVEGYEAQVLAGAAEILRRYQPRLAISAYHHFYDLFALPKLIMDINPNYSIQVVRKGYQPMVFAW